MSAYWFERFPVALFAPAAALIALSAQNIAAFRLSQWTGDSLLALLLLAQFRLWDDLADRERDRATHPHRVLVRAPSLVPFAAALVGLTSLNTALIFGTIGLNGVLTYVLLMAAFTAWYACRPARRTAATDLVLFSKYPWFALVLAVGSDAPLSQAAFGAAAVYVAACAFDWWHDAASPLRFNS